MRHLLICLLLCLAPAAWAETVTFAAADGVTVTADLTRPKGTPRAALVLFHMAGSSRGEYADIAPRLAAMGFLTLAVDQRSGGSFGGVRNVTAAQAPGAGYADAIPDLVAAAAFARSLGVTRVGAVGSSYSAALVLVLAGREPGFADAVMAFSPGEYFNPGDFVRRDAAKIAVPAFLTGAGGEQASWGPIADRIHGATRFDSDGGAHGASALVSGEGPAYWAALTGFLDRALPAQ